MGNLKKYLSILILLMTLLPLSQTLLNYAKVEPLNGYFEKSEFPTIVAKYWFDESLQPRLEAYLENIIGFRPFFIRLSNQLRFLLFRDAQANGVIVGKDNYLFEEDYILSHLGYDFVGREKVVEKLRLMKEVQDELKERGTEFLFVLAPGKGTYYDEKIPENYQMQNGLGKTNYVAYRNGLLGRGINHIDVNHWFLNGKDSAQYPLYPKNGIHWSRYGELIFLDSLMDQLNGLNEKEWPLIELRKGKFSQEMEGTDEDIEEGMNLLFQIEDDVMYYPEFEVRIPEGAKKPKAAIIADSYFSQLFDDTITLRAFDNAAFWYYNREIYHYGESGVDYFDNNFIESLSGLDLIILISTESNLKDLGSGFIEQLHTALHDPERFKFEFEVRKAQMLMGKDSSWMKALRDKANANGKPLEKVMREDAIYLVKQSIAKDMEVN